MHRHPGIIAGSFPAVGEPGIQGTVLYTRYNPNPEAGSDFGIRLASEGIYTMVSAPRASDTFSEEGKMYMYNNSTGFLLYTIDNPNPAVNDLFGLRLDISTTYTIAINRASAAADYNAYIFNNSTGNLFRTISQSDIISDVGISETYSIIGNGNYNDGNVGSGRAYIYNTSTGALLYTLINPAPSANVAFGSAVAITDNYAIVGSSGYNTPVPNNGRLYIYNSITGALLYTIENPNYYGSGTDDNFGSNIAISSTYSIVGVSQEDDASGTNAGVVYVFLNSTGALLYSIENPNVFGTGAGDSFGSQIDITNTHFIAIAPNEDSASISPNGRAYVFATSDAALLYTIDIAVSSDTRPLACSITDDYMALGQFQYNASSGRITILD